MFYVIYVLALAMGVYMPMYIISSAGGFSIMLYLDFVSLLVTVGTSYLLVAAGTSSLNFFSNDEHMELWGDLCLKMGYISFVFGVVGLLASWDGVPRSLFGTSLAIAAITVLYSLIFKYMIITPWVTCKRNCK